MTSDKATIARVHEEQDVAAGELRVRDEVSQLLHADRLLLPFVRLSRVTQAQSCAIGHEVALTPEAVLPHLLAVKAEIDDQGVVRSQGPQVFLQPAQNRRFSR
jgi:hypothetical protein